MKLTKWLTSLATASLVVASIPFTFVSCGSDFVPNEMKQFISDRTFSLMAVAIYQTSKGQEYSLVFGTGWIISDMTPEDNNDYQYHVATNWHVTWGFEKLLLTEPARLWYMYADSSLASNNGVINYDNYVEFGEDCFDYDMPNRNKKFLYNPDEYDGIDLYVCDANFANASGSIKQKLDRLNETQREKGYINKFVPADDADILKKKKYLGGYPYKEEMGLAGGKWETHALSANQLTYKRAYSEFHYIEEDYYQDYPYMDVSPQYVCKQNKGINWMTGGASGSMLVTQDYEICGIYWGGEVDRAKNPTKFWPRFSLFKYDSVDFIFEWL